MNNQVYLKVHLNSPHNQPPYKRDHICGRGNVCWRNFVFKCSCLFDWYVPKNHEIWRQPLAFLTSRKANDSWSNYFKKTFLIIFRLSSAEWWKQRLEGTRFKPEKAKVLANRNIKRSLSPLSPRWRAVHSVGHILI